MSSDADAELAHTARAEPSVHKSTIGPKVPINVRARSGRLAASAAAANAQVFRDRIAKWSQANPRRLPWRASRIGAYEILIAELMLRRTRVAQVVPVFRQFVLMFPNAATLAAADPRRVGAAVASLGLRWRVPSFVGVARQLRDAYGGRVPRDRDSLLLLPGVGDYVSSAVRAFAFDLEAVLVDTNTVRVAARYFGFDHGPETRRNANARSFVALLHDPKNSRRSAQALLDFAASICVARRPRCPECPVVTICAYGRPDGSAFGGVPRRPALSSDARSARSRLPRSRSASRA
jgi:A/G-specific adenine glycosylase